MDRQQPLYAARLSEIAAELDGVSREGTIRIVEQLLDQLTDELAAMEERHKERDAAAEARADARDTRATALFIIGVYITILLFLLQLLVPPASGGAILAPAETPSVSAEP
jgi:CHASE3 domain sensor protein